MTDSDIQPVDEDRSSYFLDGLGRIWAYHDEAGRWFSPDIAGTSCSWGGVLAYAFDRNGRGELRKATPEETAEIDAEMFS